MIAIITGDIVNSREVDPDIWLGHLKTILRYIGKSPKVWEIYRGDSFQVEVPAAEALHTALLIKAAIKSEERLDVRLAIGLGNIDYRSKKITESNGEAFIRSGDCFEGLKKRKLGINTPWSEINDQINLYLDLASLTIDGWAPATSDTILLALKYPDHNQKKLSKKAKKSQSTISANLSRSGYTELMALNERYTALVTSQS